MPSDLVADAVLKLRKAGKPVIVSQGDVAASGGYWISMDGSEVLTTPLTLTGSIGVIGGWLWDDGFMAKAGVTSDHVQRGAHADLFRTVNLPFLGGIPARAMNDDELERARTMILEMYDNFVKRVAAGRGLDEDEVHAVGAGRVWMGGDAVERGLCDRFGTLDEALDLAREQAEIPSWQSVEIVEYPPRPAFEWPSFGPRLTAFTGLADRLDGWLAGVMGARGDNVLNDLEAAAGAPGLTAGDLRYLRSVAGAPGAPLLAVPSDMLPEAWRDAE